MGYSLPSERYPSSTFTFTFKDLPQALADEMLRKYRELGDRLIGYFKDIEEKREDLRRLLVYNGIEIRSSSLIIDTLQNPTTCGIDGAYVIERLLSVDIVAVAGVAVEGLAPPTETRYWPEPHHLCDILSLAHNDTTFLGVRAAMITMELELAVNAPHDVVFLDGSLTTPLIHLNQAFSRLSDMPQELSQLINARIGATLDRYKEVLSSPRSDKIYVGIPKYTSRREVASRIGMDYEDRALLSFILNGDEVVGPIDLTQGRDYWHHVFDGNNELVGKANDVVSLIERLKIIYYKPYEYFPTLRIEVSPSVVENRSRLSRLLEALRTQCIPHAILEPYPLYLADRMVKQLGNALDTVKKAATQDILASYQDISLSNMYLAMHSYRSE